MRNRPESGTHLSILLAVLILLPISSALAQADEKMVSQIEIEDQGALSTSALLLRDAATAPDGEHVILVGADGDIWLLPTAKPADGVRISNSYSEDLYAVSWHPSGASALIAGDDGSILRYSSGNATIEKPLETVNLYGESMRAVDWLSSGQKAYVGGENGSLYSYSGNVFSKIETEWDSAISGIQCHSNEDFCVIISRSDGIGVVDRDGEFHFTGFVGRIWMDVVCPPGVGDRCVIIGSGRSIAVFQYDRADPESSHLIPFATGSDVTSVSSFNGEFNSASLSAGGTVYIHIVPFAIVEFSIEDMQSYSWLTNEDVRDSSMELSGTTPMFSWESRLRDGYVISTDGSISQMAGKQLSGDVFGIGLIILVAISVPGAILGLIFMSSDSMQEKYKLWRRRRRRAKLDIKGRPKD